MPKKAIVISHERSGTSFLINAIAANFPDYLPETDEEGNGQRIDLDRQGYNFADPEEMMNFLSYPKFHDIPVRHIFKSHHPYDFFSDPEVWKYLNEQFHVFYIYRDVRDVMVSFWRHIRKQGFLWGPMTFTPSEFIREDSIGGITRYNGLAGRVMMAYRWQAHILSWMDPRLSEVCYIGYEKMSENFGEVVAEIGAKVEMPLPDKIIRPGLGGVHPWRGKVGNWKDYFDEEDAKFFYEFAGKAMKILGMELPHSTEWPILELSHNAVSHIGT